MKKLMLIVASVLALSAHAQKIKEGEVPSAVRNAFAIAHPAVKTIKWEKEGANYEAEFEAGETEQSVLMDHAGNLLETEVEIALTELPAGAKAYIAKNYATAKIKEAAKITDARGVVTYEAEMKGKDLVFDSNGQFIKELAQ